jgi:hypothetical protein
MGWFTRFTRFGDAHLVFSQENPNSCGIACVMMCVFKINKLRPGAQAVHSEQAIYNAYSQASGASYDGSAYTYTNHLATVLNRLNCGTWTQQNVGGNVAQTIIDSVGTQIVGLGAALPGLGQIVNTLRSGYPIIVLVDWNTAGAHFVVVDTINNAAGNLYASVCDPWDGDVHITPIAAGEPFRYTGAPVPFSWEIGEPRYNYSSGASSGAAGGWVVRRL